MDQQISDVALSTEAERRYLNYALSVITSRALPDVRDGLKPVQRRILFAMQHDLHLGPDTKPKKCAAIVGAVIGSYHPHGDSAVYEALVRMAQSWVLRAPLVFGHGNFGSIDGDAAAAYRYTEARLEKLAMELLVELPKKTVAFRPNFDSTKFEPVVLPARFPNLLVNGSQGIAVGMATSIPPHNLVEVCDALEALIDDPDLTTAQILKKVKGPDFPTGGELLSSRAELRQVYESGQGSLRLRGDWKIEDTRAGTPRVVITAIPYGLEKRLLIEKIADVIINKKLPALSDVRDESTAEIRIVLELKKDSNADLVMAYLCKHTPLQTSVQVNLTCLIPAKKPALVTLDVPEVSTPARLSLKEILRHFLDFRFEVVTKRAEFELQELEKRLHILEGFEKIFDALDEIIRIIRKSEGKQDAAEKLMKRFSLDEEQVDAILELKLYRLARLEILIVQKEIEERRAEQKRLLLLLKGNARRWEVIRGEIRDIRLAYGDKRRTRIAVSGDSEPEFSPEDFIIDEEAVVIVTAQGWLKRQQTVRDLSTTRIKEGDRVLACVAGSTRSSIAFFSTHGHCYVTRIAEIPSSSGYGDPIQKLFKFADGEKIVGALSFDPRVLEMPESDVTVGNAPPPPYAVAITQGGLSLRFSLVPHRDPSTRSGRKFARLNEGDEVLTIFLAEGSSMVIAAADDGHAIAVKMNEIALLAGVGKGTMLIKLAPTARLIGAIGVRSQRSGCLVVKSDGGKRFELFGDALLAARGGRGKPVVKRSGFAEVEYPAPSIPDLPEASGP